MDISNLLTDVAPALIAAGSLLWSFSKQITKIEAKMQSLNHRIDDAKISIESNRQGRIEVFGVINETLKPKDSEMSERLARLEEKMSRNIDVPEIYTRLAKLESEIKCIDSKKDN